MCSHRKVNTGSVSEPGWLKKVIGCLKKFGYNKKKQYRLNTTTTNYCPPLQLRNSRSLAWKSLLFIETFKNSIVSSRFSQNHSRPQTTSCGWDCGNNRRPVATGHAKLPKGCSNCFQASNCLHCNGGHLVDIVLGR